MQDTPRTSSAAVCNKHGLIFCGKKETLGAIGRQLSQPLSQTQLYPVFKAAYHHCHALLEDICNRASLCSYGSSAGLPVWQAAAPPTPINPRPSARSAMYALFPFIVLQVFCSADHQQLLRLSWLLCMLSRATIPCCIVSALQKRKLALCLTNLSLSSSTEL